MSKQTVYIAGPMSGIPQFNFPAFDAAAKVLRDKGYDVVSPAELDDEDIRELAFRSPDGTMGTASPNGETWGDFLSRDVKLVADIIDAVVLLDGWEESRGARLEAFVALSCKKPVYEYHPGLTAGEYTDVIPCSFTYVMDRIGKYVKKAYKKVEKKYDEKVAS